MPVLGPASASLKFWLENVVSVREKTLSGMVFWYLFAVIAGDRKGGLIGLPGRVHKAVADLEEVPFLCAALGLA